MRLSYQNQISGKDGRRLAAAHGNLTPAHLVGAPRNAMRAFNAGASLGCPTYGDDMIAQGLNPATNPEFKSTFDR